MHIYAHRGDSANYPENTLAAFASAIEMGVEGIELDVHLSSDGIPMVIHDETLERTTNGAGKVADLTAAELALLDAGRGEIVPTLGQVLALAQGKVRVNIELKDAAATAKVASLVKEFPALDWFASSADWDALAELSRLLPGCEVFPLTFARPDLAPWKEAERFHARAALEFNAGHGGTGISVWENGLTRDDVDAVHAVGNIAWVWTINDTARAQELMELGIDAVCTDDPRVMLELLGRAPVGAEGSI